MAASSQIKNVSGWHEQLVDYELINPNASRDEVAAHFEVTPSYISIVKNSDAFLQYRAARMADHHENVSKTVIERIEGIADLSLDILQERIEEEREKISLSFVKETAEMALKTMGYGTRNGGGGNGVVINNFAVQQDDLARARERMRVVTRETVVEHEAEEVGGQSLPAPSGI